MFSSSCPGHVGPCPYVRRVGGTSEVLFGRSGSRLRSLNSLVAPALAYAPLILWSLRLSPTLLYATTLGRAAAIVRNRRHIADRGDDEANGLQRAQRRLAARTRAGNFHFQGTHAVLDRLAAGIFGRHLRRIRRGLARTLEAHHAGRRPGNGVARRIGDGDDGVVEGGGDMRHADNHVLLFFLAGAGGFATGLLVFSHAVTSSLSSCRQSLWQGLCGYGRCCGYAGRVPAGSGGEAGRD